jgi:hypothetical protein
MFVWPQPWFDGDDSLEGLLVGQVIREYDVRAQLRSLQTVETSRRFFCVNETIDSEDIEFVTSLHVSSRRVLPKPVFAPLRAFQRQHVASDRQACEQPSTAPCLTPMAPDAASLNGSSAPSAVKTPQKPSVTPNVLEVVFGSLLIKPWYPSFYPEELVGRKVERLYVCQWCFKYSKELMGYLGHLVCTIPRATPPTNASLQKFCPLRTTPPPGAHIYKQNGYSLYEIDGEKHKLYAQNLSLFAKLFLDTKSVFYDVTTFLYYLLVAHNPAPSIENTDLNGDKAGAHGQVVGFFSKEKMSWDNNNLACILVFPPWQKQGLGQILMGASYEMSRREDRPGGPEKRTSPSFIHVWARRDTDISIQHCQISVASHTNTTGPVPSRAASSRVRLRSRLLPSTSKT